MSSNRSRLIEEIVALSVAQQWDVARLEWSLVDVYVDEEPQECLCGQYPIKEICTIANRLNKNTTVVGNVCVHRFIGLDSGRIFDGIKRIQGDQTKALSQAALVHAYRKGWVNEWEYGFCTDTMKKRILSPKQLATRVQINERVIKHVVRSGAV